MSIAQLFVPNDYTLYCKDIGIGNKTVLAAGTYEFAQQTFVATPAIAITAKTFRGVAQSVDNLSPVVTATLISSDDIQFVVLCIPQFTLTYTGSTAVTDLVITQTLPDGFTPQYTYVQPVMCSTTAGNTLATLTVSLAGRIDINGALGGPVSGTLGDIYIMFSA